MKWWAWLILAVFIASLGGCAHGMWRYTQQLEAEKEVLSIEVEHRGTIIADQERALVENSNMLESAVSQLQTLLTFQEAGFDVDVSTVKDLLNIAATLPYGLPFKDGHRITSAYGMRSIQRYGWIDQKHLGVDLVPIVNDWTLHMPVDGYITDWGWSDLYGKYIEITTEAGYRIFMAHLEHIYFPHVSEAGVWHINSEAPVKKGVRIGIAGSTGTYATGRHLHYEVWILRDGSYVPLDPEVIVEYINGVEE